MAGSDNALQILRAAVHVLLTDEIAEHVPGLQHGVRRSR